MRAIVFVIIGLMFGGCMQETLAPVTQAGWSVRDKQLMSNLPYAQATIPEEYRRHIVQYARQEAPGAIVVDSSSKFLYYVYFPTLRQLEQQAHIHDAPQPVIFVTFVSPGQPCHSTRAECVGHVWQRVPRETEEDFQS